MVIHHEESWGVVDAPCEHVFLHLDDHARLAEHMTRRSWRTGGGRMALVTDAGGGHLVGSRLRLAGRLFGVRLEVEEVVTQREAPYRKAWETVGTPRLLVIRSYGMGFELTPGAGRTHLRVFIHYTLPTRGVGRWLGRLFGRAYARWCTARMVADATRHFAPAPDAAATPRAPVGPREALGHG